MRFSRHSKNKARQARLRLRDVEVALGDGRLVGHDPKGNPICQVVVDGKRIWAVFALDDPELVVTLIRKKD